MASVLICVVCCLVCFAVNSVVYFVGIDIC